MNNIRPIPLLLLILAFAANVANAQDANPASDAQTLTSAGTRGTNTIDSRYEPIIRRLVSDGWPEAWVRAKFADPRTEFIEKLSVINARKKSSGASGSSSAYAWVNTKESALACSTFIETYRAEIESAEQIYGVDKETIAALLRCETRHGQVTGKYHVFSVFASTALMPVEEYVERNVARARQVMAERDADSAAIEAEVAWIRARAVKRGNWAYGELVNLLKIERHGHIDGMSLYGSWAGAFGWSQFLPSSYLSRAVDGNGDGRLDLFTPADAIHSVANYLKSAGYRSGSNSSKRKAIYNYNNSTAYVNSILGLAERVRKME
jgi:membrane-bound lytic murein transglycosylase B